MTTKLKPPFKEMYENYLLSKENDNSKMISEHWNVFQNNFDRTIEETSSWKSFLRNSISIGFNDNLMDFGNTRFLKDSKFKDGWELRKNNNFENLINEKITNNDENQKNIKLLNYIFSLCGADFVIDNIQSNVGSPVKTFFKLKTNKYSNEEFYCNYHDLVEIYHFFVINKYLKKLLDSKLITLLEIGSGYGGLISKIKKKYKNIRCILIDLPEMSAVQTYYLSSEFPNAKILFLKDFINKKNNILDMEFDFLILPFWEIEKIPKNCINLIINIRSMMEMKLNTINFYFKNINRIISNKGFFICFNRYQKNNLSKEVTVLKDYPFDLYWKIILSETSKLQNRVHQLILERKKTKNFNSVKESMKNYPPIR
tara:strand:- start:162 stop:1271 length:1110 start_codon:yes stop_codon:yes gene_type:complete